LRSALLSAAAGNRLGAQGLDGWHGVRPRLFLTAERLAALRDAIQTTHAAQWAIVRRWADSFVKQGPPAYQETSDTEQLWQREVGNKQPFMAIAYLLSGERAYRDAAARWALASCSYPTWGMGSYANSDLAAGHQLFGLALVYDWLHGVLEPAEREAIRHTLLARGRLMYAAAAKMYWRNSFLQNHLWVNVTGLAAAGLTLFDDQEAGAEVREWIALALDKMRRTEAALGPDGASHEGVAYWTYGVEYMLKFWYLAAALLGEDLTSDWWRETAAYRLYMSVPRAAWTRSNLIVDLADGPRYDWYGPEFLLRELARRFRDPQAQWLAAELESRGFTQYSAAWLNLVWYDPTVEAKPPDELRPLRHFKDMDIVAARSDWSGDESLVVFKCGPAIGREAIQRFDYDPGGGHVHPDTGHFLVFGAGEWLIRDDQYAWKLTSHHNTLLVDGKGQLGEGSQWFRTIEAIRERANPRILQVESSGELDHISGDATEAYPRSLGLKRFIRHLLFLKPDVLIVVDDVETEGARPLELRLHPEYRGEWNNEERVFRANGKTSSLRLELLTPSGVQVTAGDTAGRDRSGNTALRYAIRLEASGPVWRNAVALSWRRAGEEPARVALVQEHARWVFDAEGRTAILEWNTNG